MCRHNAPEEVQQAVEEEIGKLRVLETASSEYNVSRNYLDWLTSMPYGVYNEEKFDIAFARQCLDEDHYGMQDVKDGILEFIAVGKLNNAVQVRPRTRGPRLWTIRLEWSTCSSRRTLCMGAACMDRVKASTVQRTFAGFGRAGCQCLRRIGWVMAHSAWFRLGTGA